jgi:hypothetical protein
MNLVEACGQPSAAAKRNSTQITTTMDIRLLRPSDIPHVQHANITNLPEK